MTATTTPTTTAEDATPRRVWDRLPIKLTDGSPAVIYVGLALTAIGFVLIAFTWGKVAGTLSVGLQLPYMVSGGLTALAFVIIGMTLINVATRQREAAERARQLERLLVALEDVKRALQQQ